MIIRFYCLHLRPDEFGPNGNPIWPVCVTLPSGEWFTNAHSVDHAAEQIATHNRRVAEQNETS